MAHSDNTTASGEERSVVPGDDISTEGEALELINEFAEVRVEKVRTRNGVRLQVTAPRRGLRVRLCPLELESLTWQEEEVFSSLLGAQSDPEGGEELA